MPSVRRTSPAPTAPASPKPRSLRVSERASLATGLSKLLGRTIDPRQLTGRLNREGTGGAFNLSSPARRADGLSGMFSVKDGAFSLVHVDSTDPLLRGPRRLFPVAAGTSSFTGTGGASTAPAVPHAPLPSVPLGTPAASASLPPLSGDVRTQATQYLELAFRLEARAHYANRMNAPRYDLLAVLPDLEKQFARDTERVRYTTKYEPSNAAHARLVAQATEERLNGKKNELAKSAALARDAHAEFEALRRGLEPLRAQGEAALAQLEREDPALFAQLRDAAMSRNGLTPPAGTPGHQPTGAPLIPSPNGNLYGADAQGHGNLLAADPDGHRWGYVNPTPVVNPLNPWTDTGRLP